MSNLIFSVRCFGYCCLSITSIYIFFCLRCCPSFFSKILLFLLFNVFFIIYFSYIFSLCLIIFEKKKESEYMYVNETAINFNKSHYERVTHERQVFIQTFKPAKMVDSVRRQTSKSRAYQSLQKQSN